MADRQTSKQKQPNIAEKYDLPVPLEYCRLDRAARLLECEVGDLIHFAAIGAIKLFVNGFREGRILSVKRNDKKISPTELLDLVDKEPFFDISKYSQLSINDIFSNHDIKNMSTAEVNKLLLSFSGFWEVASFHFTTFESEKLIFGTIHIRAIGDEWYCSGCLMETKEDNPNDNPLTIDELWILRSGLEKLYNAIKNKTPLPNIYNNTKLAAETREREPQFLGSKPHHRSGSTAINREQVLAAAVHVREMHPDECQSFSKWAQAVHDHYRIYWPDLEEPPLTLEKTERIIASAMNFGKPDKKN